MFKFTYSDKNIYVKLIRMIIRCFCYLNINKHNVRSIHNFLYKILLRFKDKGIKLFFRELIYTYARSSFNL